MPGSITNIEHARKAAGLRAWARGSYPWKPPPSCSSAACTAAS